MIIAKKIIGWVLLGFGVLIIFWTLYSSYNIFIAQKPAPEIFKPPKIEETPIPQQNQNNFLSIEDIQQTIGKTIEEKLKNIIPPELLPKIFNLLSWSIFAGILVFGGGKISGIGIRLLIEKQ